jgi:hypothetical protein
MKATVKEAQHPVASVSGTIADLLVPKPLPKVKVDFAGKTQEYPLESLVVDRAGSGLTVKARLVLKLTAHDIERPSLLGAAIKDDVPVDIDLKLAP